MSIIPINGVVTPIAGLAGQRVRVPRIRHVTERFPWAI